MTTPAPRTLPVRVRISRSIRSAARYLYYTIPRRRITVRAAGQKLRFDVRARFTKSFFLPRRRRAGHLEFPVTAILERRLEPDSVFFDIGANVGFFTILAAHLADCGSVHAFEANPYLIEVIRASLDRNDGIGTIHLINAAIGDTTGQLIQLRAPTPDQFVWPDLLVAPGMPFQTDVEWYGKMQLPEESWRRPDATGDRPFTNVLSLRLDDYCEQTGTWPDVIKIDIEGAEALAIGGMTKVLERRPVLLMELHPTLITAFGTTAEALIDSIARRGFSVEVIREHRGGAVQLVSYEGALDANPMLLFT